MITFINLLLKAHHWQGHPHIRIQQHTHPPPSSSKPRTTTSPRISTQQHHHQQSSSTAFNPDKSNNNNRKLFTQPFAPQHSSSPDSHSAHPHGNRHYRQHHYNPKHPSQHPSISPNMQNAHYIPHHHYHHQKKALSPHMTTSPSMPAAQNIPMSHAWSSPGHVPVQSHQAYVSHSLLLLCSSPFTYYPCSLSRKITTINLASIRNTQSRLISQLHNHQPMSPLLEPVKLCPSSTPIPKLK